MANQKYKMNDIKKRLFCMGFYLKEFICIHLLSFFLLFFSGMSPSLSNELSGSVFETKGLVWEGSFITVPENSVGGGLSAQNSVRTSVIASDHLTWGSVDGYYGVILAPGIVAVIEGYSYVKGGTGGVYDYISNVNFNFNSDPVPSAQNSSQSVVYNNGVTVYQVGSTSGTMTWTRIHQSSLRGGVYIGSSAKSGTYSFPSIYVDGISKNYIFGESGSFIYRGRSLECTISAPPTIAFGQVNINGIPNNGLLASKVQGIDISCAANGLGEPGVIEQMNISFNGEYQGANWGRLSVKNSSGGVMGYIRGRYLDTAGLCAGDSENEVGFNGTSGTKEINNVGVGTTHIPITWSLCSSDSGLLGDGSAQATVNIDWD